MWQETLSIITFSVVIPKCLSWISTRFKFLPKVSRETRVTPFCFAFSVYLLSSRDGLEFCTSQFILLKGCIYVASLRLRVKLSPSDWFQDYSLDFFLKLFLDGKYYQTMGWLLYDNLNDGEDCVKKKSLLWVKRICYRLEKYRIKCMHSPITKIAPGPGTTSEVNIGFNPSGARWNKFARAYFPWCLKNYKRNSVFYA